MAESDPIDPDRQPAAAGADDGAAQLRDLGEISAQAAGEDLLPVLEALLFVAPGAVPPMQLAAATDRPLSDIEKALERLEAGYSQGGRGLRLQRYRGRVQLITAPQTANIVERFLGLDAGSRLSRAALEALAIILYRQPVTRPQIDAIRGVNSDGVLKGLLMKGMVQEVGRAELPGRPILYSATAECLQYFGLASLTELPPLDLDGLAPAAEASTPGEAPAAEVSDDGKPGQESERN